VQGELGDYTTAGQAAAAAPVQSVAGKTGAVALAVSDVSGAAPTDSPTLTGTVTMSGASSVTVPTVAIGTNSTAVASTAFVAESRNLAKVSVESDDFTSGGQAGRLGWTSTVNGTQASVVANSGVTADGDGVVVLSTGSNASGRAAISREAVAGLLPFSRPWLAGTFRKDWRVLFPVLPTGAVDFRTSLALGVGATVSGDDFVSGVGLRYDSISAQWVFVSRNAAADVGTPQNTGIAPTAATWQYIYFVMNSTNARVFIGATKAAATLRATIDVADLTFAGAVGPIAKIRTTAGATSRQVIIDLYEHEYIRTTAR